MYILSAVGDYSSGVKAAAPLPPKPTQTARRSSSLKPRNMSESDTACRETGLGAVVEDECPLCNCLVAVSQNATVCRTCGKKCHSRCLSKEDLGRCCPTSCSCHCGNQIVDGQILKCLLCEKAVCSTACFYGYNADITGMAGFCETCVKTKTNTMFSMLASEINRKLLLQPHKQTYVIRFIERIESGSGRR